MKCNVKFNKVIESQIADKIYKCNKMPRYHHHYYYFLLVAVATEFIYSCIIDVAT